MRTDTTALQVTGWLADGPPSGFDSGIRINASWWQKTLGEAGRANEMPPTSEGQLSRSDIFRIASLGLQDPQVARTVLWASLAWGEGTRAFRNPGRVRAFLTDADHNSDLLTEAAGLSRTEPEAAYRLLNGQIKNIGPAFFTKYLYFAGAGDPEHPSLILDARVAAALRDHCGWDSLRIGGAWPPDTYGRYCSLLQRWARELTASGKKVHAEHLEFRLFTRK